jgi:hypothetical protein
VLVSWPTIYCSVDPISTAGVVAVSAVQFVGVTLDVPTLVLAQPPIIEPPPDGTVIVPVLLLFVESVAIAPPDGATPFDPRMLNTAQPARTIAPLNVAETVAVVPDGTAACQIDVRSTDVEAMTFLPSQTSVAATPPIVTLFNVGVAAPPREAMTATTSLVPSAAPTAKFRLDHVYVV